MTSSAQLAANTTNAQKYIGPKSEPDKQRTRLNAFKHGLTGRSQARTWLERRINRAVEENMAQLRILRGEGEAAVQQALRS